MIAVESSISGGSGGGKTAVEPTPSQKAAMATALRAETGSLLRRRIEDATASTASLVFNRSVHSRSADASQQKGGLNKSGANGGRMINVPTTPLSPLEDVRWRKLEEERRILALKMRQEGGEGKALAEQFTRVHASLPPAPNEDPREYKEDESFFSYVYRRITTAVEAASSSTPSEQSADTLTAPDLNPEDTNGGSGSNALANSGKNSRRPREGKLHKYTEP